MSTNTYYTHFVVAQNIEKLIELGIVISCLCYTLYFLVPVGRKTNWVWERERGCAWEKEREGKWTASAHSLYLTWGTLQSFFAKSILFFLPPHLALFLSPSSFFVSLSRVLLSGIPM